MITMLTMLLERLAQDRNIIIGQPNKQEKKSKQLIYTFITLITLDFRPFLCTKFF